MKRVFSLVISLVIMFSVITVVPTVEVQAAGGMSISQLKQKFPNNAYWNHTPGSANNPDGYTWTACKHGEHKGCNFYGTCGCNSYSKAIQCLGFAFKLGLDAFNSGDPRNWTQAYSVTELKPGDIIRFKGRKLTGYSYDQNAYYDWGHSIFVTGVSGETVTYADCNAEKTCKIQWDKQISKTEIIRRKMEHVRKAPRSLEPIPGDTEKPKITSTYVEDWNVGSMGFVACVKFSDNVGVDNNSVGFNIWSEANGQDDMKWYKANVENGMAWVYIELSKHGNHIGKYIINPYVTDKAGNSTSSAITVDIQRASVPASNRQTIKDGTYLLKNGASYNMDVHGGNSGNGTRVENYHYNGTSAQQFRFEYKGNGNYLIYPACAPGKVLDVLRGGSWQDTIDQGDAIDIWEPGDFDAQLFKVIPVSNGQYVLELSTKKNHVIGGKHNYAGTQLYLQEYTNYSASCKWKFTNTSGGAVDPCNHSYTNKITKAATCTATGTKTYTCACGNSYTETIAATGHNPSGWIVGAEAKPGIAGYKYTKCWTCGKELKRETIPALGVPLSSFTLSKTSIVLNKDNTQSLSVTAYMPSNTTSSKTASWKSSNAQVATVNSQGLVKGITKGDATITCTIAGISKTCQVTVNAPLTDFTLNQSNVYINKGNTYDLYITGYTPNETTSNKTASWKSSNSNIVTVDNNGQIRGVGKGTVTITCTVAGISKTCQVTVNVPLTSFTLNKTSLTINKGKSYAIEVTGYTPGDTSSDKTAVWKSSNTKVATVDNKGVVKGIAKGTATITCTVSGISKACKVTVGVPMSSFALNKTSLTVSKGKTYTLAVKTYSPSDTTSSKAASWKSSNAKVATVSSKGVVKGISTGTATITCTVAGISKTCKITVGAPLTSISLNKTSISVNKGKSYALKVTKYSPSNTTSSKTAKWKSSNTKVATVDSKGVVKGIAKGSATITCTVSGITKTCKVTVAVPMTSFTLSKTSLSVNKGKTYALKVTKYSPSDTTGSKTAKWKSSNTKVATVDSKGVVKGIAKGSATITCTVSGISKTCKITVKVPMTSFALNRTSATVAKGKTYALKPASYSPSDTTSSKAAKWKSSNTKVATVDSKGIVKGIAAGSATITCTISGISKTCKVTVATPAPILATPGSVKAFPKSYGNSITWNAVSGASGYQVYVSSTGKSGTYSLFETSTRTSSFQNLPYGTTRYYRVRAFKIQSSSKVYSAYSSPISVKNTLAKPSGAWLEASGSKNKIYWTTVPESDVNYELYFSSTKSGDFTLLKSLSNNSYTHMVPSGKAYYYKVRAYRYINGKKCASVFSNVLSREIKTVTLNDLVGEWYADAGAFYDFNGVSLKSQFGSLVYDSNRMIIGKDGKNSLYALGGNNGKGRFRVDGNRVIADLTTYNGKNVPRYFTLKNGDSTWLVENYDFRDGYGGKNLYVYWRKK